MDDVTVQPKQAAKDGTLAKGALSQEETDNNDFQHPSSEGTDLADTTKDSDMHSPPNGGRGRKRRRRNRTRPRDKGKKKQLSWAEQFARENQREQLEQLGGPSVNGITPPDLPRGRLPAGTHFMDYCPQAPRQSTAEMIDRAKSPHPMVVIDDISLSQYGSMMPLKDFIGARLRASDSFEEVLDRESLDIGDTSVDLGYGGVLSPSDGNPSDENIHSKNGECGGDDASPIPPPTASKKRVSFHVEDLGDESGSADEYDGHDVDSDDGNEDNEYRADDAAVLKVSDIRALLSKDTSGVHKVLFQLITQQDREITHLRAQVAHLTKEALGDGSHGDTVAPPSEES